MKWLTIILSLYLLGLSVWPCADEYLPTAGQDAYVSSTAGSLPGSAHQHEDQCTPFCTCACCAATLTVLLRYGYNLIPPTDGVMISTDHFTYSPTHWATPDAAIWQPPQIRV